MESIFMGHSDQRWENIEAGRHVDSNDRYVYPKDISVRYAQNLINWYLSVKMSKESKARFKGSKLYKDLKEVTNPLLLQNLTKLDQEVTLLHLKPFGNEESYQVILEDAEVSLGDIVLTGVKGDDTLNYLEVGMVEKIETTDVVPSQNRIIKDVITDASETFKKIKNQKRVEGIKIQIEERIEKVDKEYELEAYAKVDDQIRMLLDEYNKLD